MRTVRTRRRAVFRASAVITTAALAAAVAPAAFADPVQETVSQIVTRDDGTLAVQLSGAVQPLWVQFTVRSSTGPTGTALFTTDDTVETPYGGYTSEPVVLPAGTAYGDYAVDVDFRLPGGTTQHWNGADAGAKDRLNYRRHASVTDMRYDRDSTDFDHRTAVLTGSVRELDPATGQTSAAPAATHVRLNWYSDTDDAHVPHTALVDTGATGAFSLRVTPNGRIAGSTAVVEDPAPDTTPTPVVAAPNLGTTVTAYRITAAQSRNTVHKGESFTLKGSVQRLTPAGWAPFAGAPVVTTTVQPNWYDATEKGVLAAATTGADGGFSYAITAARTTTHYTFLRLSPYLTLTDDTDTVRVPTPGRITLPAYSLDRYGLVKSTGRLNGDCGYQTLWLQFSRNGRTGWQNITHITTGEPYRGYCSYALSGYGDWDGYYRVYHPETSQLLSVSSPVHRLKRTRTALSVAMTPSRPYLNAKLTASGVVTQYVSGHWAHYAKAHVVLVYRPKGDPQWYWVVKGYTNSAGRYTLNTKAYGDGTWGVYVDADSTHFYSESKDVYVDVR